MVPKVPEMKLKIMLQYVELSKYFRELVFQVRLQIPQKPSPT